MLFHESYYIRKRLREITLNSNYDVDEILMDIALNHNILDLRLYAIKNISDENLLAYVACKTDDEIIGFEALKNIKSKKKINSIALNAKLKSVRNKSLKIMLGLFGG